MKKQKHVVDILMERDGMTWENAHALFEEAREDLKKRFAKGELTHNICEEWFGLSDDHLLDFLD